MSIARPELGDEGLDPTALRVDLVGPLAGLQHPPVCPACGAPAGEPIEIVKVFQWNFGQSEGSGWKYRIARTAPLFCTACAARHRAEQPPVTGWDRARSLLTELTLPAVGTGLFGLLLLRETADDLADDPVLLLIVLVLLAIAAGCGWGAWTTTEHRRQPMQTLTSRAFDFGDDQSDTYTVLPRTYALRSAAHAAAFDQLNRARRDVLGGPAAHRAANRAMLVAGVVVAVIVVLGVIASRFS